MLGTPSEDVWPGVSRLRDWHEFPQWKPQDLSRVIPELDAHGIDLMSVRSEAAVLARPLARTRARERGRASHARCIRYTHTLTPPGARAAARRLRCVQRMLQYDPAKRIHATDALKHPYFDTLDKGPVRD